MKECSPLALRATKQMMLQGLAQGSLENAFSAHYPSFQQMLSSEDAREGVQALLRKESLFGSVDSSVKLLDSGIYTCQFATDVRRNSMWKQLREP